MKDNSQNKVKLAFNNVKADEELKTNTISYIKSTAHTESKKQLPVFKLAAVVCAAVVVLVCGVGFYGMYNNEYAVIYFEDTANVKMSVNMFDKVISANGSNADGEKVLKEVNVQNKAYGEAITEILSAQLSDSQSSDSVSVSVECNDENKKYQITSEVENSCKQNGNGNNRQVDCYSVTSHDKQCAEDNGITVGKYKKICKIIDEQGGSINDYKDMTMHDLNSICNESGNCQNGQGNSNGSNCQNGQNSNTANSNCQNNSNCSGQGNNYSTEKNTVCSSDSSSKNCNGNHNAEKNGHQ